ncbi:protein-tyrosine phosphatase family protein [Glutamicibacter sp.]|uniref:protein-tyrosine phosphatase family protein n=1 Tax=Glutamicibacter sp. TaxID=1931995 RepID=UPI0028BD85E7|nr:protein-tyrosine phosphatase family protein [Glutamicibacter sp.]
MGCWELGVGIVEFPDGRRVRGRGLGKSPEVGQDPELGVYLLGREPQVGNWPMLWIPWKDFRLPTSTDQALDILKQAHQRAAYERVEIACHGGTGRTGTALAVLAMLSGVPSKDAVRWVRQNYRNHAVETWQQKRWIRKAESLLEP